jgi:pSer/pThr/pTyr-binding forkhead associated (FHA) protein
MAGSEQQPASVRRGEGSSRLESFDDWAHLLRPSAGAGPRDGRPEARPFRPLLRRPMALLHVVDDGRDHGEVVRLRGDRLVIGRSEGDLVIPHDISMSPKHAAIDRLEDGAWLLSDLGSSGGTFVRVTSARLRDGTTIRIGATMLRFQAVDVTEGWLVEMPATGLGRRHECHGPVTTVGREGCGCGISLRDPFVSPVHAEVHGSARGWRIDNAGTNGLWVRLDGPVRMTAPSQFLCGEQRFVFEPLAD